MGVAIFVQAIVGIKLTAVEEIVREAAALELDIVHGCRDIAAQFTNHCILVLRNSISGENDPVAAAFIDTAQVGVLGGTVEDCGDEGPAAAVVVLVAIDIALIPPARTTDSGGAGRLPGLMGVPAAREGANGGGGGGGGGGVGGGHLQGVHARLRKTI